MIKSWILHLMRKGVDVDYVKSFGKHLAKVRKENGLSQEELAYKIDLSLSQIARIETGKINTTLDTIKKIADGIGVDAKMLLDF